MRVPHERSGTVTVFDTAPHARQGLLHGAAYGVDREHEIVDRVDVEMCAARVIGARS
jgi:hypothetical protein